MNEDVPSGVIVIAATKVRSSPGRARVVVDLDFSRAFLPIPKREGEKRCWKTNGTFMRIQMQTEIHRSRSLSLRKPDRFSFSGKNRVLKADT